MFSNLRVYEKLLDVDVEGSTSALYGGKLWFSGSGHHDLVDRGRRSHVADGGQYLEEVGADLYMTPDTVLEFDFASSREAKSMPSALIRMTSDHSQMFQLYGATCGIQAYPQL